MARRVVEGPAIGIDLGTTYSCVAVWQHGKLDVIVNGQGNRTTPSFVAFTDSDLLVGEAAFNQSARNPSNTIFDAKRLIGRVYNDTAVQEDMKMWPFKVEPGGDGGPVFVVVHEGKEKRLSPEEISSMVLSHMKAIAEAYLGTTVRNAVVTVPAYFNNSQRQATKDAAAAAGLNVIRVINEPTAAAMAYGLDHGIGSKTRNKKNVLVFDLGGGTFDVSLLSVGKGAVNVIAMAGDTHLGGVDFDSRLVDYCAERFRRKHGGADPRLNPKSLRRLRAACERAKRALSFAVETTVDVEYLYDGEDFQCTISAAKFEELNMDLFTKCMSLVDQCLEEAHVDKAAVNDVVLVGGSTRIPKVQELLKDLFHLRKLCHGVNPDEAVAAGAAIHAALLAGSDAQRFDAGDLFFSDVSPLSLGINTAGGKMSVLIPKNTPIPTSRERVFTTSTHNQSSVRFHVYEGDSKWTKENNHLGDFELWGIPAAPRGVPRVVVRFDVDVDGLLVVTAEEGDGKVKVKVVMDGRREEGEEAERRRKAAAARVALENYACDVMSIVGSIRDVGSGLRGGDRRRVASAAEQTLKWVRSGRATEEQYEARRKELQRIFCPLMSSLSLS